MNLDLTNRNALVCGASQGLGFATAVELAGLGANIIMASRSTEKLKAAVQQLDVSKGQRHSWLTIDLSEPENVKQTVEAYLAQGNVIHILVNNAGGPPSGP